MKKVTYPLRDGSKEMVEYDETAPCRVCGLPVIDASMGGTDLCPWCDMGKYRDGSGIPLEELEDVELLRKKAKEKEET